MKKILLLVAAGAAVLMLAGCNTADTQNPVTIQVPTPSDNVQKQKLYNYLLNEQGVDVVRVGETATIVIASDQLFVNRSANFDDHYIRNLKIIARLINSYDTTNVAVMAYTDQSGSVARALTEKQAQKVLSYLKKHGVDTRLIYAKGYGNLYPVTVGGENSHFNRRVEIKFQFHQDQG